MARLVVKVVPGSSRDRLAGFVGDALKLCVTAPPERGRANAAATRLLARALELPEEAVRLVSGRSSPRKTFEIEGLERSAVDRRLAASGVRAGTVPRDPSESRGRR